MISEAFEKVLTLFGCSAAGTDMPDSLEEIDWQEIRKVAKQQGVWNMLTALLQAKGSCPNVVIAEVKRLVLSSAVAFIQRQTTNLRLISELEKAGLHPVVMKGMAVSRFYRMPEVRLSADMDILLPKSELIRANEIMCAMGYSGEEFNKGMYHVAYTHPSMGMVELHIDLYSDFMEEVWFNRVGKSDIVQEPYERVHTEDGEYWTLGATDQLIFLSLHMAKHLIGTGLSLRLMMDAVLYARCNHERIDSKRYWQMMKQAKLNTLMATVFTIAERYWGIMRQELLDYEVATDDQCTILLQDLSEGGAEGRLLQADRENGWYLFHKEKLLNGRKEHHYERLLFFKMLKRYSSMILPGKEYLENRYPCVRKYQFLLPIIWGYWLVTTGAKRLMHWKENAFFIEPESTHGQDRMEMFKKMNMV